MRADLESHRFKNRAKWRRRLRKIRCPRRRASKNGSFGGGAGEFAAALQNHRFYATRNHGSQYIESAAGTRHGFCIYSKRGSTAAAGALLGDLPGANRIQPGPERDYRGGGKIPPRFWSDFTRR